MASLTLKNIRKSFGRDVVLPGLSLDVADGQFVVLVGPSGCGKTTTLRVVAGLEEIDAGEVRVGDRDVTRLAPKDRDVAMVFQSYALYPHMNVAKNLGFALTMRGVAKQEIAQRVKATAEMLEITDLLAARPSELSGGQRQRVAVGRAIVREPRLFLFDEPLSNLDARLRTTTRAELKALHQRLRTTTLYVTHDQEEAMTLGERVVVMHRGVVMQDGPPLTLYERPANRFVAGFIGSPPMNLLHGEFEGDAVLLRGATATTRLNVTPAPRAPATREAIVGIRPEHVSILSAGTSTSGAANTWSMQVEICEPLGDRVDLHGTAPGPLADGRPRFVARVPTADAADVTPGSSVSLFVAAERVHLFAADAEGARL